MYVQSFLNDQIFSKWNKKWQNDFLFTENNVELRDCEDNSFLWFHGYRYAKSTTFGDRTWWVCSRKKSMRCPASIVTFDGHPIEISIKKHTHKNYWSETSMLSFLFLYFWLKCIYVFNNKKYFFLKGDCFVCWWFWCSILTFN